MNGSSEHAQARPRAADQRRREEGHALVLALFTLLLVSLATALVATGITLRMHSVQRGTVAAQVTAIEDAAIAETLARLSASDSFSGIPRRDFGTGWLSSQVERNGSRARLYIVVQVGEQQRQTTITAARRQRGRTTLWRPVSYGD